MRILLIILVGILLSNCTNSYVKNKKMITSPKDLQKFYSKLHEAEVRHSNLYINLYRNFFGDQLAKDIQPFSEIEASLITQPDPLFRFHSGI